VKRWQAKEITLREGDVGSMGRILCLEHCITTKRDFCTQCSLISERAMFFCKFVLLLKATFSQAHSRARIQRYPRRQRIRKRLSTLSLAKPRQNG
jgi:hypothetical protein